MELGVSPTSTLVKWISITLCSFCFAVIIYLLEGIIDSYIRPYCPPGYWHEGFRWAHCAIPAISIAKHVFMYCTFSLISITLVYYIKPEPILKSIKVVFFVLLTIPMLHIIFNGISWAALLSFISVAIVFLFARFFVLQKMHNKAQQHAAARLDSL